MYGLWKKMRQWQNWCSKGFICNRTFLQDNKICNTCHLQHYCENTNYSILTVIIPVFSIWPHVLIHITHYSGKASKASWEESFGIPYLSLAVFSWDVLGCRIHCIQEGHLVLWTMIKKLFLWSNFYVFFLLEGNAKETEYIYM